ncbi:hypothetical protein STEG23_000037, partial [Scotinomys teguina]
MGDVCGWEHAHAWQGFIEVNHEGYYSARMDHVRKKRSGCDQRKRNAERREEVWAGSLSYSELKSPPAHFGSPTCPTN